MKKLIKRFKQISILILAITFVGCQDDNADLPKVLADFTYTVNSDTGVVTFINLSENATNYTWDFGDGGSSTLINPVRAYQNGTYTVVLKSSVAAGSTDTFQDEITILIPEVASLPISFDGANTKYDPTVFGGASFSIVDNPDPSGDNTSTGKVGSIVNSGAAYEGLFFDLGSPIDLSLDKTIKLLFWSDKPVDVLLKLESGTAADIEVTANHGGSGWETLYFTFDSAGSYSKFTMFVDGAGTTSGTFYIDDITQIETPVAPNGCSGTVVAATTFPVDFEACESFIDSFTDGGSITTELAANPDKAGINTSDYALKVVKATATNRWAGIQNAFPDNFDATKTLKMKVYSSKANVVMKIEVNSNPQPTGSGNPGPQYATITDANTWTDVEVTFTGIPSNNTGLNQIVIKPDNPDGTDGTLTDSEATYYFDDIEFVDGGGSSATAPTTAAPTPTQDAANVVSIFSDAYTDLAGTNFNPGWGQTTIQTVESIAGNNTLKYANFNYQGTDLSAPQDLSTMEFVHIDVWTADATVVKFTPIGGGETLLALTPLTAGQWNSYDIPLSDFTSVNTSAINQLKFDGQDGVNPSTIYVDNIYFYKAGSSTPLTAPNTAAPTPTQDAANVVSVFSDAYTDLSGTNFNPGWGQTTVQTVESIAGNNTLKFDNFNYQGIDLSAPQDLSTMEFLHVDVWTADATVVKFTPIGGGETLLALTPLNTGQWNSYDIPLTDYTGVNTSAINQLKFDGQDGVTPSTIYVDNIYFYKAGTTGGGTGGCTGTPVAATAFPVNFESCESFISTFTDGGSITTELAANPSSTGINTSAYVLKVVKATGTNRWAGFQNAFPSNFDATKTFKVKVYSSKANVVMKFEVNSSPQDAGSGNPGPQYATITDANTWTEVQVTFTGIPPSNTGLNQLVIKPDNPDGTDGTLTDTDETYYFDDIRLE
ncbi:PKD domain-containing protein [Yeosuana marina]|uniref:PKD domain-containing protein n=1 Tax=Yeosuana marina TaxID=1565536 RepID=UPI0030EB690E|tara:strand:+ start:7662 stop:10475 length:2814 start_codon:yes stop_codon:yes gene_type:complete